MQRGFDWNPDMQVKKGFTLIEVLVIIAIISLLAIAAIMGYLAQLPKSRDAARKADLDRLKIAFEDYYNDNNCYPPSDILSNCASDALAPYITGGIPCDPHNNTPYCYIYDAVSPCQNYRLLASLENTSDEVIVEQECDPELGCGFDAYCGGSDSYNYITASGNLADPTDPSGIVAPTPTPQPSIPSGSIAPSPSASPSTLPTPTPTSQSGPGPYACQATVCNNFGYPNSCPISFASATECISFCASSGADMSCN